MEQTKLENIKVTTYADYQKAAMRTCTESSRNISYMALELVSEVGEVMGKVAKAIRDDNGNITPTRAEEIAYELGDVMWGVAGLHEVFNKTMLSEDIPTRIYGEKHFDGKNIDLLVNLNCLMRVANEAMLETVYETFDDDTLGAVVENVGDVADAIGYSLQTICQMNIDKLTDRYNRNMIAGSGDHR